jgi:hypothetical protein
MGRIPSTLLMVASFLMVALLTNVGLQRATTLYSYFTMRTEEEFSTIRRAGGTMPDVVLGDRAPQDPRTGRTA